MKADDMEKIPSFSLDHDELKKGLHKGMVCRGVTTWDLRFKTPNGGDYISPKALHSVEHMLATVLRNSDKKDDIIYFGPMGCRTGFYLLLSGDLTSEDVLPLVADTFRFIRDFSGEIPGASAKDCGNYLDMNLPMAQFYARRYVSVLETAAPETLRYPE